MHLRTACALVLAAMAPAALLPGLLYSGAGRGVVGGLLVGQAGLLCLLEELLYSGNYEEVRGPGAGARLLFYKGQCRAAGQLLSRGGSGDWREFLAAPSPPLSIPLRPSPAAAHVQRALDVPALAGGWHLW